MCAGIEGVSTVLCTIVDYKGQRYIGQSIIPGIFTQGENSATLMHGMLDKNKHITVSANYSCCVYVCGVTLGTISIAIDSIPLGDNRTVSMGIVSLSNESHLHLQQNLTEHIQSLIQSKNTLDGCCLMTVPVDYVVYNLSCVLFVCRSISNSCPRLKTLVTS